MSQKSFLILGRQDQVAFAEIYQYFLEKSAVERYWPCGVILNEPKIGKTASEVLGGVPKSGFIIGNITPKDAKKLSDILLNYIPGSGKFNFGLSGYSAGIKINKKDVSAFGLKAKKILKEKGISSRLVDSKSETLSSVDILKNKLISRGVELCLFFGKDNIIVGKTESVQPYEQYSDRDYGRPFRDSKRGMIPPKLARSMINLCALKSGLAIMDPFCGAGTIIQEALLMGYEIIGSDIDARAVSGAKKNINWILQNKKIYPSKIKIESFDVRKISHMIGENSVDGVVSEFDLGPPLLGGEDERKVFSIARSLSDFYFDAMDEIGRVLKPGGRAVLAWPYFPKHNLYVSDLSKLSRFKIIEPYPAVYQSVFPLSCRKTLLYGRPGQSVFREIIIFKKK